MSSYGGVGFCFSNKLNGHIFRNCTMLSVLHFGGSVSCFERIHPGVSQTGENVIKSENERITLNILPCEGLWWMLSKSTVLCR